MMKKQLALKIVNVFLFFAFIASAVSMVLYRWGPEALRGTEVTYGIHGTAGIVFFVLASIHLLLNFKWIIQSYFTKKK
jgi:hypothetical protein